MPHTHNIVDAGNHFVIDPLLRTITSTNSEIVLVQGDHNSERYTFEIPRFVEGHDMSLCNRIEIHYDNISRNKKELSEGFYISSDANIVDNNLTFSWLVSGNATRLSGTMQFWINFRCINADGNVVYSWGTDVFKSVRVISNNQNTNVVVADFPDVLELWKKEIIKNLENTVTDDVERAEAAATIAEAAATTAEAKAANAINAASQALNYYNNAAMKSAEARGAAAQAQNHYRNASAAAEQAEQAANRAAAIIPESGMVTSVNGRTPDENGNVEITIPSSGDVDFKTDNTLKLENGILSVNTTNQMEQDNTLPITSAGVYATVGNIEALLKTI